MTGVAGIKDYPKKANWLPLSRTTGRGAEAWLAPESWDIQPSSLPPIGPLQKSLALTPEDVTSDEMEQSDYESWSYGKKKLSTVRIFRQDSTYTVVNCVFHITTSELIAMLGRKIFKPDTSKYHLFIQRNNIGNWVYMICVALQYCRNSYFLDDFALCCIVHIADVLLSFYLQHPT